MRLRSLFFALLLAPVLAFAQTTTLCVTENASCQNVTPDSTVTGVVDTDIYVFDETGNFNTNTSLLTGRFGGNEERNSLIECDLSDIPASQEIVSATVYVNLTAANDGVTVDVFGVVPAAILIESTWLVYSTGNAWNTAGAQGSGTDRSSSIIDSVALGTSPSSGYRDWDVTSVADAAYGASAPLRMLFVANSSSGNNSATWRSSNVVTDTIRPECVIVYQAAAGGSIVPIISHNLRMRISQ